ncbi:MAG TPA: gliding motility-associated C-terminal domain-containing protein [Flavisolibacter sp.]|nr:gliding motility-associated C-terminal domain-containing protein [Flavisolibacter sp.]
MPTAANKRFFCFRLIVLAVLVSQNSFSQCAPQMAAPPASTNFNSGIEGNPGHDKIWLIGKDSITANYVPATIMTGLPTLYYNSKSWISFSETGEHSGNRYFFYKTNVDLACSTLCGKSYNEPNSFCLNLDLYADNSIYEIYVNGVPQSSLLANIPLPNPFNPAGHTQSDRTPVSLCRNWKAGSNTVIIQIASSATIAGLMVEGSSHPPPPPDADTVAASICEGETFSFAGSGLGQAGYYFHSFQRPGSCDSNVVLHLNVKAKARTTANATICEGQSFEGNSVSGTYTEVYAAANSCDSIRTIQLTVVQKPKPDLGNTNSICDGDTLQLYPGTFSSYLWQDGSTGDRYVVTRPGLYSVTAANNCGSGTTEVLVNEGVCQIYFPTAFTPNTDGRNDAFRVLTDYKFETFHLTLYNRWGEKIFESYDPSRGWDGNYHGKASPSGAYIWFCQFRRRGNASSLRGTVTVIR